jgi:hypothetical protein
LHKQVLQLFQVAFRRRSHSLHSQALSSYAGPFIEISAHAGSTNEIGKNLSEMFHSSKNAFKPNSISRGKSFKRIALFEPHLFLDDVT